MGLNSKVYLLFPFDMGLELDFSGKDTSEFFKEISVRKLEQSLVFEDKIISGAELSTQVYRFGVGMIEISFMIEGEPSYLTHFACKAEAVHVGKTQVTAYCHSLVESLIQKAKKYATYSYEHRLSDEEIFPIFELTDAPLEDSQTFLKNNYKTLFGLVVGEPEYNTLSDFVLAQQKLENNGYYENDLILVKRFGAVIRSKEANDIVEMIKLAFAQYWSMRSYNFILDFELQSSQKHLQNIPPYYKFWLILGSYQDLSKEALDFDKDKISIVDSLYNVLLNIPKVESDWHLRTVYENVEKAFNLEELHKTVEIKIERIAESYNSARDYLSTNFFILLDIIFALSLIWSVIDTYLFWVIAQK
jgi:hypothetical protein